jgi:TatD DNase family protein
MSAFPHLDAHLHLQDQRLEPNLDGVVTEMRELGISRWVVNGTSEADWPRVAELAKAYPEVLPAYGLHPWFVKDRTPEWEDALANYLSHHAIAVGEVGLDKWIRDHDIEDQETVFRRQLRLATATNLPVVIHCLKAWGRLLAVLKSESLPPAGFLLHSFAGPREMIEDFIALGARFSFSGNFLQERKADVLETFRHIPRDRILIETDAPDMALPENLETHPLNDSEGQRLNHPANLLAVYRGLADALSLPEETLATQVAENFERFYGTS